MWQFLICFVTRNWQFIFSQIQVTWDSPCEAQGRTGLDPPWILLVFLGLCPDLQQTRRQARNCEILELCDIPLDIDAAESQDKKKQQIMYSSAFHVAIIKCNTWSGYHGVASGHMFHSWENREERFIYHETPMRSWACAICLRGGGIPDGRWSARGLWCVKNVACDAVKIQRNPETSVNPIAC